MLSTPECNARVKLAKGRAFICGKRHTADRSRARRSQGVWTWLANAARVTCLPARRRSRLEAARATLSRDNQLTLYPKHVKSPAERSIFMRGLWALIANDLAGGNAGRLRSLTKSTAKTSTKTV
jgi:hypothetical protein